METKENNVKILKDKACRIKTAMLTTYTSENGFHSRPMGTADIDNDGNIWFFTNEFSEKVEELSLENKASITYVDHVTSTYLSITGKAMLVNDKEKMKKLWNPFVSAFFPDGLNDPKLTLLMIETSELEYWESHSSKMVLLFNMLKANLLGEVYDEGEHGKIKLKQ